MRRYLSGLRISHKILISSLVFALPILVLLFYMVTGFYDTIRFSRQEVWGMEILDPLKKLSELLSEHQLLVRLSIQGNSGLEQRIDANSEKIEKAFSDLLREGSRLENVLQIGEKALKAAGMEQAYYRTMYKNWQELNSSWKSLDNSIQNDARHEMLLQPIQVLVKKVGDTSNMVLDPDLGTTYLIEVALASLPRAQERLTGLVLYMESLLFKGFRSRDDVNRLVALSAFLENDLDRVRGSISTALHEDKNSRESSVSLHKNIPPALSQYESALLEFLVISKLMVNDPDYRIPVGEYLEAAQRAVDAGSALRRISMNEARLLIDKRISFFRKKAAAALSLSLATLFAAIVIVAFISRGITRPLRKVAVVAGEIAAGNIQMAGDNLDAIGREEFRDDSGAGVKNEIFRLYHAIKTMTSDLDSLLAQVRKSGLQVTVSSTEIAASARQLEATVAEQAASISQVNVTSAEISATAQDFATRMDSVTKMASEAAELAGSSMESLSLINVNMQTLLESTAGSSQKLNVINDRMGNISQVITAITKVANQINLLSLNAAIEAEKAGDYGIGFSVVAREIRRLADQTAVAALEIEGMIVETQVSVKDGMAAVEMYTRQTGSSTETIAGVSAHLEQVIGHTRQLQPQLEAVNRGMHVQRDSAGQISEAMAQLNDTARQTRDSLVEFKRVTEQLNEAARGLQDEVTRFAVSS